MRLSNPEALLLLLLMIPLIWTFTRKRHGIKIPSLKAFAPLRRGTKPLTPYIPLILRCLVVACLAIAMARPQEVETHKKAKVDALDMMLVIDTSGSMQARDFVWQGKRPTRLAIVKAVISEFIANRAGDRIGLVIFGTEAFTQAPLTLDHQILTYFLAQVEIGVAGESTAVGDALLTAANRLSKAESKAPVVILLTDGASNAGRIDPIDAANAAKSLNIKVYTIGAGSRESGADFDDKTLKQIAELTGGEYFSADNTEALRKIYQQIDKLERSKVDTPNLEHVTERYFIFIAGALVLLILELLFGFTKLGRIP